MTQTNVSLKNYSLLLLLCGHSRKPIASQFVQREQAQLELGRNFLGWVANPTVDMQKQSAGCSGGVLHILAGTQKVSL